ncbi:3-dehydroquinate dehydratase [Paracoccus mutanolyticus]|uniref:3-dehydroquinate dehydratase n=2 Tax=Paracoccus mutanolyticus TaxID=1499308 RepID=A0ABM6WRB5_9RHOB|nr:3-dehydroquinate dehydratase [Paracoccus mutanolyticus]
MATVYILNGPNLNLLGQRQPEIYGSTTLADVERACADLAGELGFETRFFQSNHEGVIVDTIHEARHQAAAIVINPGALTHTSVAILDALNTFDNPVIEVHISNMPQARKLSILLGQPRAEGPIAGLGTNGYLMALRHLAPLIGSRTA